MKIKCLILLLFTYVVMSNSSFAINPTPTICPSVNTIKAKGKLNNVWSDPDHKWWCMEHDPLDKYDTETEWNYWVCFDTHFAKNKDEALKKANDSLESLQFISGPICNDWWCSCRYSISEYPQFHTSAVNTVIRPTL